jgi:hypothetical protein
VERRSLWTTALAAAGTAVLVALVVLVIKVRAAPPDPDVDPAELSRATSTGRLEQPRSTDEQSPPRSRRPGEVGAPRAAPVRRRGASLSWPRGEAAAETGARASDAPAATPGQPASAEIATEYYDSGDYESARKAAVDALRLELPPPAADKMLRIAASASCFMGEPEQARVHYEQLAPRSQRDIARRCRRMGIEF